MTRKEFLNVTAGAAALAAIPASGAVMASCARGNQQVSLNAAYRYTAGQITVN